MATARKFGKQRRETCRNSHGRAKVRLGALTWKSDVVLIHYRFLQCVDVGSLGGALFIRLCAAAATLIRLHMLVDPRGALDPLLCCDSSDLSTTYLPAASLFAPFCLATKCERFTIRKKKKNRTLTARKPVRRRGTEKRRLGYKADRQQEERVPKGR